MITHNVSASFLTTQALVKFIYLGHSNISKDNIAKLFLLAKEWQIEIPRDNGTAVDEKSDMKKDRIWESTDDFNSGHGKVEGSDQYFPLTLKYLSKTIIESNEINAEDIIFPDNTMKIILAPLNAYKENKSMPISDQIHSIENGKRPQAKRISKKPTNFIPKIAPNEENQYICNMCDAGIYSKWDSLKRHILKKHEGYSYECPHCGQYFSSGEVRRNT